MTQEKAQFFIKSLQKAKELLEHESDDQQLE